MSTKKKVDNVNDGSVKILFHYASVDATKFKTLAAGKKEDRLPGTASQTLRVRRTTNIATILTFIEDKLVVKQRGGTKPSFYIFINDAFSPAAEALIGELDDLYGTDGHLKLSIGIKNTWG